MNARIKSGPVAQMHSHGGREGAESNVPGESDILKDFTKDICLANETSFPIKGYTAGGLLNLSTEVTDLIREGMAEFI